MKSANSIDLVVYGREACHLCEQMIRDLEEYERQGLVSFNFQVIDIDTDPELVARFNDKIPVLMSRTEQKEICHYHLDIAAVDEYLAKFC